MNRDSINEMEQIQKGLEQFLQQEVKGYKETSGSDSPADLQTGRQTDRTADSTINRSTDRTADRPADRPADRTSNGRSDRYPEMMSGISANSRNNERELQLDLLSQNDENENVSKVPNSKAQSRKNREYASEEGPGNFDNVTETGRENDVRKASRPDNNTGKKKKNSPQEETRQKSKAKGRKADKYDKKEPPKGGKKKKSKIKRFFITILVLILILSGLWYWMIGSLYGKMNYKEVEALAGQPMKEDGVTNILLIGNDSRSEGEDGRSDAMILLSISNKTKTIHMTSLLRDMYVEIPGYKGNRLNAAYSYGGAQLLMETVEQNLGIPVNRYMLVNFQAFANLIDAVGGVELELTNEEVIYINGYLVEYNILMGRAEGTDYLDTSLSGMVHLNGPQALAFSRNRYLGTDFGRTERQRKVLTAAIKKVPMSLLTGPKKLTDGLLPNLTTNLTKGECLQLSLMGGKLLTYEIVAGSIPVEGSYKNKDIRGMAVLEVDFEKNKEYIQNNIYGK